MSPAECQGQGFGNNPHRPVVLQDRIGEEGSEDSAGWFSRNLRDYSREVEILYNKKDDLAFCQVIFFVLIRGYMPQDWWCIAPLFNLKNAKKEGEILLVGGVNSVLFAVAFLRMRHIGKKKRTPIF